MIQFFQAIGQFLENIGDTLSFLFGNLHFLFDSLQAALNIGGLFIYLPPFISGIATITLVVAIVMFILKVFHG